MGETPVCLSDQNDTSTAAKIKLDFKNNDQTHVLKLLAYLGVDPTTQTRRTQGKNGRFPTTNTTIQRVATIIDKIIASPLSINQLSPENLIDFLIVVSTVSSISLRPTSIVSAGRLPENSYVTFDGTTLKGKTAGINI